MYEYKIMEAKNIIDAQEIMNEMSKDGWRVISTFQWTNWRTLIVITFEREINL